MNKVREVPTFFMFFPFPFLQEGTVPSPSAPPGESNDTGKEGFNENFENDIISSTNFEVGNIQQNASPYTPTDPVHNGDNDYELSQTDSENMNYEIEKLKEEIMEGTRRLWEPPKRPWIMEDLENNIKTILWQTMPNENLEVFTVGISLIMDENNILQWTNKTDFIQRYAPIIVHSENDIRLLYYILNIVLDEVGEEQLAAAFSEVINLNPSCWFHYRVIEDMPLVPLNDIKCFIDKSRNISTSFDKLHDKHTSISMIKWRT